MVISISQPTAFVFAGAGPKMIVSAKCEPGSGPGTANGNQ